jgi:outer membrane lipoprotein carrier protein
MLCSSSSLAAGLVEKVQQTYRQTEQFRADFVQTTKIEVLDRVVEEKGQLVFAKPGKFLIHYRGARERKYISDGKTLWIYRPKEKEVEIYEDLKNVVAREALAFLGGLGEMTKEFRVNEKGGELLLVPKRKGAPFVQLILKINPESHLVQEATLFPKSGNESRYLFSAIRVNEPVPETTFEFHESGTKEVRPMEL